MLRLGPWLLPERPAKDNEAGIHPKLLTTCVIQPGLAA